MKFSNFGVYFFQLFSLAQAYLRDTAVLVLDEPVAIVSQETKHLIQEIIKTSFKNKTVMFLAVSIILIPWFASKLDKFDGLVQDCAVTPMH